MWAITTQGFYSAVAHDTDPDVLVVRSRAKVDALALAQYVVDVEDPRGPFGTEMTAEDLLVTYTFSDYPWRVMVNRATFRSFLADTVTSIDYGNFKDAVKAAQGAGRAAIYANVWQDLLAVQVAEQRQDAPDVTYTYRLRCGCEIDDLERVLTKVCHEHDPIPF